MRLLCKTICYYGIVNINIKKNMEKCLLIIQNMEIVVSILQIITPLLIAVIASYISHSFNTFQKREIEQKYNPFLVITKCISNYSKQTSDKCEFPNVAFKELKNNNIPSFFNSLNEIQHVFYEDCKYFILNLAENNKDRVIELAPSIIFIKNIGFDLYSYIIKQIKIVYRGVNNGDVEKVLKSSDDWQQNYVSSQKEFYLVLGVITNNYNNTLCRIDGLDNELKNTLESTRMDILKTEFSDNFLAYKKMEIMLDVKSAYSKIYQYKMTLEVIRNRLCASTEEITKE